METKDVRAYICLQGESDMNLGEKIRQLRVERRLTQEQLAEKLYVSFQTVSKWETGRSLPDIGLLPVIAECFSVSLDELFDYRPEPPCPDEGDNRCVG